MKNYWKSARCSFPRKIELQRLCPRWENRSTYVFLRKQSKSTVNNFSPYSWKGTSSFLHMWKHLRCAFSAKSWCGEFCQLYFHAKVPIVWYCSLETTFIFNLLELSFLFFRVMAKIWWKYQLINMKSETLQSVTKLLYSSENRILHI